ncbi:MAG: hypothetical protein ACR2JC_12550 [Chloroflexota bacterium]
MSIRHIHPDQICLANEIFSPTEQEVAWARQVIETYETAAFAGHGAAALEGIMIDAASIRLAESTLNGAKSAGIP